MDELVISLSNIYYSFPKKQTTKRQALQQSAQTNARQAFTRWKEIRLSGHQYR